MYIGSSLVGFWGFAEDDHGCPDSPTPYPVISPSRIGASLLPFRCPGCFKPIDFSDAATRERYHDTRPTWWRPRDNYWCPKCGRRFKLDLRGIPVTTPLAVGTVPPCAIGGLEARDAPMTTMFERHQAGIDVLGARL